MKFTDFIKKNLGEITLLVVALFIPFLTMNILYIAVLTMILTAFVSFLMFRLRHKESIKRNKEQAILCFFASLLESIEKGYSLKNAYEGATKFLIGYATVPPYDEMIETENVPFDLGKYNKYMVYLIQMEKNNECHLKNYSLLIKEVEQDISRLSKKIINSKNNNLNILLSIVSTFAAIGLIMNLFPAIFESIVTNTFCWIEGLCQASIFFFVEFNYYYQVKGASHVILQ